MNINQEKIKKEQEQIIGIIPSMDMKGFVTLLLVDLASKSPIHYFDGRNTKTAVLSTDYKRIIEGIMYKEGVLDRKFAELINIHSYYEFQSDWEEKLGKTINKVLNNLNKKYRYDFEYDEIEVDFTPEEINQIKSNYDEESLEIMDHFSTLINDCTFDRKWKLEFNESNRSMNRRRYNQYITRYNTYKNTGIKNPEKYIGEFNPTESRY